MAGSFLHLLCILCGVLDNRVDWKSKLHSHSEKLVPPCCLSFTSFRSIRLVLYSFHGCTKLIFWFFFFPCSEREVPTSNIDLHYAHCSRNLQKCTICGEMVPKKHADMHYTETHAPVWSNDSHPIYFMLEPRAYIQEFFLQFHQIVFGCDFIHGTYFQILSPFACYDVTMWLLAW